jgi:hypothetical protein
VAHNFQVAIEIAMRRGFRRFQMKTFMLLKSLHSNVKRYVAPQDTVARE